MTADRRAQGLREPEPGSDRAPSVLPAPDILSTCDRLLGEVGRRDHMFAWLRASGSDAREWLAVDAYYPRARLAVMCRPRPWPHEARYRELIPAHGLGLLSLDPTALGSDRAAVERALEAKLFDLERAPRVPAARRANGRPVRVAVAPSHPPASQVPDSVPAEWTPLRVERTPVATGVEHGLGLVLGLLLAIALIAELYLAFTRVAVGGRIVMAVAIAIEACSRAVGTVAAERAGQRGWAAACAIGGSPVVAWYALLRPGRVDVEPAPLAGRLAVLAGVLALVALLTGN